MPFSVRTYRRLPLTYVSGFILFIALLVLSSGPAYAEWVAVHTSDIDNSTDYVDPDTIRRNGNLVKMWILTDYKTIQTVAGSSFSSIKGQKEYDCADERSRTLTMTVFLGNMGSSNLVSSNSEEEKWQPVAPGSIAQVLWKLACGKK